ncbi:MAG: hypothetical protein ABH843_02860 [Candidatus Omnitrophota bacterium]
MSRKKGNCCHCMSKANRQRNMELKLKISQILAFGLYDLIELIVDLL